MQDLINVRNLALWFVLGGTEMATVSVLKALTGFFNVGDGKRPAKTWLEELKTFTPEEKFELAALVVAETGDALAPLAPPKA